MTLSLLFINNKSSSSIRPYLSHYAHTPNRLAAGEQTIIVMSSRVAQKSYGNEKRYVIVSNLFLILPVS